MIKCNCWCHDSYSICNWCVHICCSECPVIITKVSNGTVEGNK